MFCRAVLHDVELLGPLEALSVGRTLLASHLLPGEISRLAGVRLRHVTAEGLSLFERSLLADGADEDIASSDEPGRGLSEGQAFGGSAALLLDLLGAEPFRGLNAVVRVEGCLLPLNWL
jgi:hypothetical protein